MSISGVEIWERQDGNPLLWLAMAGVALAAHLGLLHLGLAAYQAQIAIPDDVRPETKIIATALQVAGTESPPPPLLEATPVAPAAPEQLTVESLQPSPAVSQTLSAAVATTSAVETVETLAAPTTAPPSAEITATSQAPATSSPVATAAPVAPVAATQAPVLSQPGVAPAPAAPQQAIQSVQVDVVQNDEAVEVATLDAPTITGVEEASPTAEPAPPPAIPQPPAPLPELATSLPPPPSDLEEDQAGVASANAPEQTTEEAKETYDTVLDFLRSFDGGPCFAALPVLAEDGAFRFETFANSRADLGRFRQALEVETGTLPGTVMKPVSDAQCQALPFVTKAARYPEFQLYFDIATRDIPSGETLSGKLGNTSGGFVSLLLIDDEGVVQDLGSFLKFRPGYAGFDIPMTLKGSPVETQQLLMALSTRSRLKTLQTISGQPAADFFQRLAVEILLQGGGEDVALVAFSVR
ncbi:hypothetical protein [Litoreibacter janthinus]|uniref:Uncharacterized protein n=1 Tax=Litoreibacter janthinus TaxID=670154 RepID=A0A1I6IDW4_9RHOB|nr:hypothetical protein [Litoreibacter janthinus]SFR64922.1 hypothetical protein SAMN04488002_3724 [Litoreibacter janthinus]